MAALRFHERVVIVTGGAGGIGLATAHRFGREGARVVIADRDDARGRQAAAALHREGGEALALACDVASEADVIRVVDTALDRFGRLDVIVNNAGRPLAPLVPAIVSLCNAQGRGWGPAPVDLPPRPA